MKNTFYLFVTILTFVLLGCSDDSDSKSELSLSESIIGTWTWESFKVECDDPQFNIPLMTVDENSCITIEGDKSCDFQAIFSEDKTVKFSITNGGDTSTAVLSYSVDDKDNSFELCNGDDCQTFLVNDESFEYIEDEGDCKGIYNFIKS